MGFITIQNFNKSNDYIGKKFKNFSFKRNYFNFIFALIFTFSINSFARENASWVLGTVDYSIQVISFYDEYDGSDLKVMVTDRKLNKTYSHEFTIGLEEIEDVSLEIVNSQAYGGVWLSIKGSKTYLSFKDNLRIRKSGVVNIRLIDGFGKAIEHVELNNDDKYLN